MSVSVGSQEGQGSISPDGLTLRLRVRMGSLRRMVVADLPSASGTRSSWEAVALWGPEQECPPQSRPSWSPCGCTNCSHR